MNVIENLELINKLRDEIKTKIQTEINVRGERRVQTTPADFRADIQITMCSHAALLALLTTKKIITYEEYFEMFANILEIEAKNTGE